jgi:hypothetical protein
MPKKNRYSAILEKLFSTNHKQGATKVEFKRTEIGQIANRLKITLPKNLGDLIYSFRYRVPLPESIQSKAPKGQTWIIRPAGPAKYRFDLVPNRPLGPNSNLAITKVPDSTPGIIAKYALSDEQALLAKVRYNRLVDIFTGVVCYSLQSHLRSTVKMMGQVETDEIYVGVDKKGVQYVFPVQAKGGKDKLSIVQIEQDIALCAEKFSGLECRAIGAQFMHGDVIALFEFENGKEGISAVSEKHYKLVPPDQVTADDLKAYRERVTE